MKKESEQAHELENFIPSGAECIRIEQDYVRERDAAAYRILDPVAKEVQRLQEDLVRFLHRCSPNKRVSPFEDEGDRLLGRIIVVIRRASDDLEDIIHEEARHLEKRRQRRRERTRQLED
jgi:hypothetical protein